MLRRGGGGGLTDSKHTYLRISMKRIVSRGLRLCQVGAVLATGKMAIAASHATMAFGFVCGQDSPLLRLV